MFIKLWVPVYFIVQFPLPARDVLYNMKQKMPLGNKFATLNHMSYVLILYPGDLEASMTKSMKAKL